MIKPLNDWCLHTLQGTIPHIYASVDCTTNKLTETRKQLARDGVKISVNDLIVKACALALQVAPPLNFYIFYFSIDFKQLPCHKHNSVKACF